MYTYFNFSKVLTAAISNDHRSGFSTFFLVLSKDRESTLIGQLASGPKYSFQISSTLSSTTL